MCLFYDNEEIGAGPLQMRMYVVLFSLLVGSPELEEKQGEASEIRLCVVLLSRRFQSRRTSKNMERALLLHVGAGRTASAGNMHFPLSHSWVFGIEVKRDFVYQPPHVPHKLEKHCSEDSLSPLVI